MTKWKCIDKSCTHGFTNGKVYEVEDDGTIHYDSGNASSCKLRSNGTCWWAKFIKVEENNKVEELKIGDRVVVNGIRTLVKFNNESGKIISVGKDIGIEFDRKVSFFSNGDNGHDCFGVGKLYHCWWVNRDMITKLPSSTQSIHITVSDTATHAVLKDGDKVVKRATAKLCPTDTFDFQTGAKLAFDRLFDNIVVEDKPKFVKAKIGDTIKIVKDDVFHCPPVKIGDEGIVVNVGNDYIETGINGFFDSKEEYIIVSSKPKLITDYSADELLSELKRRING